MTKREAERQTAQENTLIELGFTREEADQLRRISMRLHSWYERECGNGHGAIERDEETDKPYWYNPNTGSRYPIRDLERGAERRLKAIISARNQRIVSATPELPTINGSAAKVADVSVSAYLQTDPRGAALYLLRPGDVPDEADVQGYYNRGICIY